MKLFSLFKRKPKPRPIKVRVYDMRNDATAAKRWIRDMLVNGNVYERVK